VQLQHLAIRHAQESPRQLQVRTGLTTSNEVGARRLCVMFLQDLRELEAGLRTEKLAAMGRMSAAVAHEIRNPLAAIAQANALLDEDLSLPQHKQLTLMVSQNAQRLGRIVDEVLDISRVKHAANEPTAITLRLDDAVQSICQEWARQNSSARVLQLELQANGLSVNFEIDHLRRLLINLLDNALRYAGQQADSIRVSTRTTLTAQVSLQVWSDGQALEESVQRHLFEPFFSSESRSSGLGLFICRELCERHGAVIGYQRSLRQTQKRAAQGNEFFVAFRSATDAGAASYPLFTQPLNQPFTQTVLA
jgi:two-component system, NtrC family, sensor histidine kinase PilS